MVHEIGEGVTSVQVGDRVAVNAVTPDGTCDNCQAGYTSQCGGPLGGYRFTVQKDGNMAEYFHVNDADYNLAPIPEGLADEVAVYACDMLSTGLIGSENANIPVGGSVAIFAQGAVGLSATLGAKLRGAGLVITVEGLANRQAVSRQFGADVVIDPASGNVAEQIIEMTNGGADSTVEALGNQATFEGALYATRPGGTLSNVGYHGESGPTVVMPLDAWGLGMAGKKIVTDLCPGGTPAHGAADAPALQRQDRPHADDHPPDGHRRRRGGLRHDDPQARRHHQAADHLLITPPSPGRPGHRPAAGGR